MPETLKLRQVKAALGIVSPFFAAIGLIMNIELDPRVRTVTADGRKVRFNPDYFAALDFDHAVGIVAQKSFQCAAKHHVRMVDRPDAAIANMASQHVANLEIRDAGYLLPPKHLYNPLFRGWSFERVYNWLEMLKDQQSDQGSDEEGEAGGSAGDAMPGDEGDESEESSAGGDQGDDPDQVDYGGCGSIQPPTDDAGNSLDTMELAQHQSEWDVAVREGEMVMRRRDPGNMPGALTTLSKQAEEGRQDWREIVRRWMRSIIARNYTFFVPDRRFRHQDLWLPSLHSKRIGRLGIGSDTSASVMTKRQVRIITDEMNTMLLEVMPQITTIVYCDTVIQAVDEYMQHEYPIELHLKGQGGTKVSPIFQWFEDNDIMPVGLIIFTDLEIDDFPSNEPAYPVLWASTGKRTAPWGDVVMLDEI